MGEMKSAWQLAAEKAGKLGELSPEEQRRLKEQEYGAAGTGLAERFVAGGDERDFVYRLEKFGADARPFLTRAALHQLVERIDLGSSTRFETIRKGVEALAPGQNLKPLLDKVSDLFVRYRQVESEVAALVDREGRGVLHGMRVSGSAVGQIEARARPEWRQKLEAAAQPLAEELAALKAEMLRAI